MIRKFVSHARNLFRVLKEGLFHVLLGELGSKVLRLLASVFIVRVLDKSSYGVWVYVMNIVSIVFLFDGFGIKWGVLHFCSKGFAMEEKRKILRFAIFYGLLVDLLLFGVCTVLIVSLKPFHIENGLIIGLTLLQLIGFVFDVGMSFLRAIGLQKSFGMIRLFSTFLYTTLIFLTLDNLKVYGIVLSEFLSASSSAMIVFSIIARTTSQGVNKLPDKTSFELKDLIRMSALSSLSSSISQLLYLMDTFLIAQLLRSSDTLAVYKVATIIPFNLTFIPISISGYFYPKLSRSADNKGELTRKIKTLTLGLFLLNVCIVLPLIVFSNQIVSIVFGSKYLESSALLRILLIGYIFAASLRIPLSHAISAMGELKQNLINSLISGVTNVILDIILISRYRCFGAAIATSLIFVFSSFVNLFSLIRLLRDRTAATKSW